MVFNDKQTWAQKTLAADDIYKKVVQALKPHGLALPKTPRRPDIRLIVENNSGETIQFMNPGDHAKQQPEISLPAERLVQIATDRRGRHWHQRCSFRSS